MLKVFEKYSKEKEILDWLEKFDRNSSTNQYTISDDGVIGVDGDVDIKESKIKSIPYQFGQVTGSFDCRYNQLTNLRGVPSNVGGSFYCSVNELTNLQYAPSSVGGEFGCAYNQLTSLKGCPSIVGGSFWCFDNQLISLQYAPSSVGGYFRCSNNELINLQHAPSTVGGKFYCFGNKFQNMGDLVGLPKVIKGRFECGIPEAEILGADLLANVILPNYEIFEDMDILYEEAGEKYYQPNALRGFIRQEAPSMLSKVNLKEIENKFIKIGYTIS
jgi:hypothetical protein